MLAWSSLVNWSHEMKLYCHLLCKVGGASEKVFSCVSNKRAWLCSWDIQMQELPLPKYGTVVDMKLKVVHKLNNQTILCCVKSSESLLHMWVSSCAVQASMGRGGPSLIWSLYKQDSVQCTSLLGIEQSAFVMGLYSNKKNLICFGR